MTEIEALATLGLMNLTRVFCDELIVYKYLLEIEVPFDLVKEILLYETSDIKIYHNSELYGFDRTRPIELDKSKRLSEFQETKIIDVESSNYDILTIYCEDGTHFDLWDYNEVWTTQYRFDLKEQKNDSIRERIDKIDEEQ